MKIIPTLMKLCLNRIHGEKSWLYSPVSAEDARTAYLKLVDIEHKQALKSIARFTELSKDEQNKALESIRNILLTRADGKIRSGRDD